MFKFFHGNDLGENGRDLNCNELINMYTLFWLSVVFNEVFVLNWPFLL